ncbi:hypothetical protein [Roseimarinus sediminis]|uniref:hypothetical protein n=1 Tax=Roseimarinus sediminis TaxID=1610899 RepID=UPI003D1CDB34
MENYDKHKDWDRIFNGVFKTNKFFSSFCDEFVDQVRSVVGLYYPEMIGKEALEKDLLLYAREMLSAIEAIQSKDESYSPKQLAEEVKVMTRLIVKKAEEDQDPEFIDRVHAQAKAMLVKYYPEIPDLSASALRLLEKNSKMYNWEFITNFYLLYKK